MALVNRYSSMHFEPYQYREYPKWVTPPGVDSKGKPLPQVLVEDRDEERQVMKLPAPVIETITEETSVDTSEVAVAAAEVEKESDLEFLQKRATELGVAFSEKWGTTKLRRAIQEAKDAGAV